MVQQELKTSIKILKEKGFLRLIKEFFKYFGPMVLVPKYIKKIKKISSKDENYLVNFAFNSKFEILAPAQSRFEIASLMSLLKKERPKKILEVGTAKGGSLFLITKILPDDAEIMSLDLRGGSFGGGYPKWRIPLYKSFVSKNQKMELLRGDSHKEETVELVKNSLRMEKLDFLFIDADHTYEGVKKDFENYSPFVKKGGIIALHDIAKHRTSETCKVDKFWEEIKNKHDSWEFLDPNDIGWAGIGVLRV